MSEDAHSSSSSSLNISMQSHGILKQQPAADTQEPKSALHQLYADIEENEEAHIPSKRITKRYSDTLPKQRLKTERFTMLFTKVNMQHKLFYEDVYNELQLKLSEEGIFKYFEENVQVIENSVPTEAELIQECVSPDQPTSVEIQEDCMDIVDAYTFFLKLIKNSGLKKPHMLKRGDKQATHLQKFTRETAEEKYHRLVSEANDLSNFVSTNLHHTEQLKQYTGKDSMSKATYAETLNKITSENWRRLEGKMNIFMMHNASAQRARFGSATSSVYFFDPFQSKDHIAVDSMTHHTIESLTTDNDLRRNRKTDAPLSRLSPLFSLWDLEVGNRVRFSHLERALCSMERSVEEAEGVVYGSASEGKVSDGGNKSIIDQIRWLHKALLIVTEDKRLTELESLLGVAEVELQAQSRRMGSEWVAHTDAVDEWNPYVQISELYDRLIPFEEMIRCFDALWEGTSTQDQRYKEVKEALKALQKEELRNLHLKTNLSALQETLEAMRGHVSTQEASLQRSLDAMTSLIHSRVDKANK